MTLPAESSQLDALAKLLGSLREEHEQQAARFRELLDAAIATQRGKAATTGDVVAACSKDDAWPQHIETDLLREAGVSPRAADEITQLTKEILANSTTHPRTPPPIQVKVDPSPAGNCGSGGGGRPAVLAHEAMDKPLFSSQGSGHDDLSSALGTTLSRTETSKRKHSITGSGVERRNFFQERAPKYWQKHLGVKVQFRSLSLHPCYEIVILGLIVLNAIFMGVQGLHFFTGQERQWNMFDTMVVISMVVDSLRRAIGDSDLIASNFSLLRVFRLVRLMRLMQVLRVLTVFHDFHVLMGTLRRACSALMWTMLVVVVLVYVAAIAMTEGTVGICNHKSAAVCKRFGDLFLSALSLYQALFNGLDWVRLMDELLALDPIYPILFMLMISFGMVVLLNVITAVCVGLEDDSRRFEDAQGHHHALQKAAEFEEHVIERLHRIFDQFDMDGSGDISINEWVYNLDNRDVLAVFAHLDIDVSDPHGLFELLDVSQTGVLERDNFVLGCMRLKGSAKSSTLAKLQVKLEHIVNDLEQVKQVTCQSVDILKTAHNISDEPPRADEGEDITANLQMHRASMAGLGCSFTPHRLGRGGRFIEDTERRAMTLPELKAVRRVVKDSYLGWSDIISGKALLPEDVNLYTLNYYHLAPKTIITHCTLTGLSQASVVEGQKVRQLNPPRQSHWVCPLAEGEVVEASDSGEVKVRVMQGKFVSSDLEPGARIEIDGVDVGVPSEVLAPDSVSYKELVSSKAMAPKWYCSHWWGLSVLDFVASCEEHTRLRKIEERASSYWVCAYANRQHDLGKEIDKDDLENTSFSKAMHLAQGVLLILGQAAMPFQRFWCAFELYKTITSGDPKLTLDVAGVLRACGEAQVCLLVEDPLPGEPRRAKMVREKAFPHQLLLKGLTVDFEKGSCFSQKDKENILAFMAKDGQGPNKLKDACDKANQMLKAHFALLAWPFAIERNLVLDFDGIDAAGTDLSLVSILRNDTTRRHLIFSLAHFEEVNSFHLKQVAESLPPNLETVDLSFEGCVQIENAGLLAFRGKLPASITRLRINLMGCIEISDEGIFGLAEALTDLPKLKELRLVCYMCHDLSTESFVHLSQHMPKSVNKCLIQMKGTSADKDCKSVRELNQAARAHLGANKIHLPGFVSSS